MTHLIMICKNDETARRFYRPIYHTLNIFSIFLPFASSSTSLSK